MCRNEESGMRNQVTGEWKTIASYYLVAKHLCKILQLSVVVCSDYRHYANKWHLKPDVHSSLSAPDSRTLCVRT